MRIATPLLFALVLSALGACGSPSADTPPEDDSDTVSTAGDDTAADPGMEPDDTTAGDTESCYVEEVNGESGCWGSAEEACEAAGCEGDCTCTEASANNTCSC